MAQWMKYGDDFRNYDPCKDDNLLDWFNLFEDHEHLNDLRSAEADMDFHMPPIMVDHETVQVLVDKNNEFVISSELDRKFHYDKENSILYVTRGYSNTVYKIGDKISQCLLLGDSIYGNYPYKITQHFLATGEYGFHLS